MNIIKKVFYGLRIKRKMKDKQWAQKSGEVLVVNSFIEVELDDEAERLAELDVKNKKFMKRLKNKPKADFK